MNDPIRCQNKAASMRAEWTDDEFKLVPIPCWAVMGSADQPQDAFMAGWTRTAKSGEWRCQDCAKALRDAYTALLVHERRCEPCAKVRSSDTREAAFAWVEAASCEEGCVLRAAATRAEK